MRDYLISVSYMWTREVKRNLNDLLRFRIAMFKLKHANPEVFELVMAFVRGVDIGDGLAHNRNTLDKTDNDTKVPNCPHRAPPVKEAPMKGGEEE